MSSIISFPVTRGMMRQTDTLTDKTVNLRNKSPRHPLLRPADRRPWCGLALRVLSGKFCPAVDNSLRKELEERDGSPNSGRLNTILQLSASSMCVSSPVCCLLLNTTKTAANVSFPFSFFLSCFPSHGIPSLSPFSSLMPQAASQMLSRQRWTKCT